MIRDKRGDIPYKYYLEACFRKQLGLSTENQQQVNIYSFTNKRLAKGYQRVVTTCQGMYWETRKEQIEWEQWKNRRVTVGGDLGWRAEGASLYHPTTDTLIRTIVPHRFAINPSRCSIRQKMRTDRYYIHVYQTRVGPERRTLRSRAIARELRRRFGNLYWPRDIDKNDVVRRDPEIKSRAGQRQPTERRREVKAPDGWRINNGGRNLMGRAPRKPKLWARWEEWEKNGSGKNKQRDYWQQNVTDKERDRQPWSSRESEKDQMKMREISNQLKRLTRLFHGLLMGEKNL